MTNKTTIKYKSAFTIVEVLVVIAVIAVLAAITIVAYIGITQRAQKTQITSDFDTFSKAVQVARENQSKTLLQITGSGCTSCQCSSKDTGTDLAALPRTDSCWTTYERALSRISAASGMNITSMVDPWGRPYAIDENEGEIDSSVPGCRKDSIGVYSYPFTRGSNIITSTIVIPLSGYSGCSGKS